VSLPPIVYERYPGAASAPAPLPARYLRREPEKTPFYTVVREHLETFLEQARIETGGEGYPGFVEREFRRFLNCGQLSRGFGRLVAFSCKCRICGSCQARRMSETAADLRDRLLPKAPYRQWVLSFPWPMRFALAYDRVFLSKMLSAFLRAVFAWQRRRGRSLGIADGQTGAVTFVQRMGGALNLNPHAHSLLPDGLWVSGPEGGACRSVDPHFADGHPADYPSGDRLVFVQLPPPTDAEIQQLTERVARRLVKVARRYVAVHLEQLLEVDGQPAVENEQAAMHNALRASLRAPVRFAPPAPSPSVADAGGTPCLPGVNVEANAALTSAPSPTAVTVGATLPLRPARSFLAEAVFVACRRTGTVRPASSLAACCRCHGIDPRTA
jgi:hypothetical protein